MTVVNKKVAAFTLAEIIIVLVITAIVSVITIKILASRNNYVYRYAYNASLRVLRMSIGNLIADGTPDPSSPDPAHPNLMKRLPSVATDAQKDGFCDRMAELLNTIGDVHCERKYDTLRNPYLASAKPFAADQANFILSNGMRFFNMGANPNHNLYTIYIDIDGARGNGTLHNDTSNPNGDVYPFYIDICGTFQNDSNAAPVDCKGLPSACTSKGTLDFVLSGMDNSTVVVSNSDGDMCSSYPCGSGINGMSAAQYSSPQVDGNGKVWITETFNDLTAAPSYTITCPRFTTKWECGSNTSPGTGSHIENGKIIDNTSNTACN